jgi:AhpD family alkylhydroperoxidase
MSRMTAPAEADIPAARKAMSTSLDAATRQGIAHAVDEINGCEYCDAMHTWVSQQMTRLDEDEIARNRGGSSSDTRRAAALAFAREVRPYPRERE